MKNTKLSFLVMIAIMLSLPLMAQKSANKLAKETAEMVSKMDAKQQKMILNYTTNLAKVDVKKQMKKMLKKMSAEDRQKVLDYIANVQKAKTTMPKRNVKDVNANMDAAAIARAKAKAKNKTKAKAKNKPVDPATLTKVEVLDRAFDFGTIPQGEKVSTVYRIKNVGKNPLKISKAKGSCGCTVPQWPKEAIAPGEIAEIKVVFNSRGKRGKQQKRITITANTDPAQTFLTIKGTVEVPEKPVDKKQ